MYASIPVYQEPTFWLSFLYLATAGIIIARLILMHIRKYRWLSFNSGFLILCLVTCLLRTIFFMFFSFWMNQKRHLLGLAMYWFATNTQFATFSLLVVFYASITNDAKWHSFRIPAWLSYAFFNLVFLGGFIASLLVVKLEKTRDKARSAITACTFFILIIALGYYGFRVWRILLNSHQPNPKLHGISPLKLFIATLHIMVIYLSRAIYAILSDAVPSLSVYFGTAGEALTSEIISCLCFVAWEIVPTIIIIILFWETTPPASGYSQLHIMPYLYPGATAINATTEDDMEEYNYQPVPTRYLSSNAISYPTGRSAREATSLFATPSSLDPSSFDP